MNKFERNSSHLVELVFSIFQKLCSQYSRRTERKFLVLNKKFIATVVGSIDEKGNAEGVSHVAHMFVDTCFELNALQY